MHNLGFDGATPDGSARLSAQQVWQSVSEVAGQVASLSSFHTSLHSALHASLVSTLTCVCALIEVPWRLASHYMWFRRCQ